MKTIQLAGAVAALLLANAAYAQKLPQAQVPSVIVNSFQKTFPKVMDVEWNKKGELYKVEFETGLQHKNHDAWYNSSGNLVKHTEELTSSELPAQVQTKINSDYKDYKLDDIEKITEGGKETYQVELKKRPEQWKIVFDTTGNILNKKAD